AALLLATPAQLSAGEPGAAHLPARRFRQPVALAVVDGGRTLLAANRKSGSLSIIDTATRRVVSEHDIGRGLVDLAVPPDGRHLLVVDRDANELILMTYRDRTPRVVGRAAVAPDPARMIVAAGGESAIVASTWSRRLTFVALAPRAPEDSSPVPSIA